MVGSSYNLLAITLERYLMVVHPIYHKANVSRKKLTIIAIFPWVIGTIFQSCYGIPTSELQGDTCVTYAIWPSINAMRISGVISTVVPFFLPATVMIALYVRMVVVLRSRIRPGTVQPMNSAGPNKIMSKSQKNLTKTCIIIGVAFVSCWSPSQMFWLLYNLGVDLNQRDDYHFATLLMVYLNCSVNPFIYIFSYEEFQQGIRKLFSRKK